jgi:hypothetical protein
MFISKSERMEIDQRLYVLEEMVKGINSKMTALESTLRNSAVIDKKTLLAEAEKITVKKERQREYSRRYYERLKAEKAGL